MKSFIRQRLREQMIDGQNMNNAMQTICDKMTINSYEEAMGYIHAAFKDMDEKTKIPLMRKIHTPLENLKNQQTQIDKEVKLGGMSGDSMPDEANTYWSQIQSTLCEQGPNFQ